jgi:hypothetical protein
MFDAGSGSMDSIFLDGVHASRKIISPSNLSYSDDENGCAIWIDNMKRNPDIIPRWKKWLGKYGNDEKKLVATKKKEFSRCNQILQAFILDAETSPDYNDISKAIVTALFST